MRSEARCIHFRLLELLDRTPSHSGNGLHNSIRCNATECRKDSGENLWNVCRLSKGLQEYLWGLRSTLYCGGRIRTKHRNPV